MIYWYWNFQENKGFPHRKYGIWQFYKKSCCHYFSDRIRIWYFHLKINLQKNFKNNPEKYIKPENLINFLFDCGNILHEKDREKEPYYCKNSKNSIYNIPFIKTYFDIAVKYENEQEENYPFILFYNTAFKQAIKKNISWRFYSYENKRDWSERG